MIHKTLRKKPKTNSGAPELLAVPAPLVAHAVFLLNDTDNI
jgi:hypothetical protein